MAVTGGLQFFFVAVPASLVKRPFRRSRISENRRGVTGLAGRHYLVVGIGAFADHQRSAITTKKHPHRRDGYGEEGSGCA